MLDNTTGGSRINNGVSKEYVMDKNTNKKEKKRKGALTSKHTTDESERFRI